MIASTGKLNDAEAINLITERVDRDRTHDARYALERLWWENIAYYRGLQHAVWGNDNRLKRAKSPHRVTRITNLILPATMRSLAKLVSLDPFFTVAPASGDRQDRQAAKVAEKVRQHLMQQMRTDEKLETMLLWAACTGSCFGKVFWDEDGGIPERFYFDTRKSPDDIRIDLTAPEQLERESRGLFEDLPPGDVAFQVANPYQCRWDWLARDEGIDGCQWFAMDMLVSREKAADQWGVNEADLALDAGNRTQTQWEDLVGEMASGFRRGVISSTAGRERTNRTRLIEYWEPPLRKNGYQGRQIVSVGGVIVKNAHNPYGEIPFVKVDWFPNPGHFLGQSLVEQLRDPQKAYNENRTIVASNQRAYGQLQWWAHENSNVKPHAMSTQAGAVNLYSGHNGPPIIQSIPSLPSEIANEHAVSEGAIRKIAGQGTSEDQGQPGQMRAAGGIRLMQEDNNMILSCTARSMLRMMRKLGSRALRITARHYTNNRMYRVVGANGEYEFGFFRGADLRNNYEVEVRGDVEQMMSKESRVATMMELLQLGFYDPQNPEHRQMIVSAISGMTDEHVILEENTDEANAERIIQETIDDPAAQPQVAMPWDNSRVYLRVLGRFFKTEECRMLDGFTKQQLFTIWQSHEQKVAQEMEAQMVLEQNAKGAPGQKGQASQPRKATSQR